MWHARTAHAPLLRFLLLTLARIGEAQKARWADIEESRWIIPAANSKNGRAHWVYLCPPAQAILHAQPRRGQYVFGKASDTAVQAWVRRFCQREHIVPAFTPHDLRRSAATRCGDLGTLPHVVEKLLNHTMQGTLAIYNRSEYEAERVDASVRWGAELERLVRVA